MKIQKKLAKSISYGGTRNLNKIKYIVIHYTGNSGDTAKGNANYFANSNTRQAGAHYFVDAKEIWESIPIKYIAWAVGGDQRSGDGGGAYYGKCTNTNSVSIELCDWKSGMPSWEQMKSVRQLITYIQKTCPNAKTVVTHWQVNGKACPVSCVGKNNKNWKRLHTYLTKGYQFTGTVTQKAALRSSGKVTPVNKIGTINAGKTIKITKIVGKWGRLKKKDTKGRYRWITLTKVKEQ